MSGLCTGMGVDGCACAASVLMGDGQSLGTDVEGVGGAACLLGDGEGWNEQLRK